MAHRNSHPEKRDKEKAASSKRLLTVVRAMTLLGSMAGYYPLFLLAATYGLEQDGSLPGGLSYYWAVWQLGSSPFGLADG